jgi:hypothetical protein
MRADKRVTWKEGCKPVAFPHTTGTVFLSKGVETKVRWDGETRLSSVATKALRTI